MHTTFIVFVCGRKTRNVTELRSAVHITSNIKSKATCAVQQTLPKYDGTKAKLLSLFCNWQPKPILPFFMGIVKDINN